MKCPKCKFENQKNEKFCLNCGEPLKATQTTTDASGGKQPNPSWIVYLLAGVVLVFVLLVLFGVIKIPGLTFEKSKVNQVAEYKATLDSKGENIIADKESASFKGAPSPNSTPGTEDSLPEPSLTPIQEGTQPTGKIIFTCQVDQQMNHDQICIINPDGSGWKQLTDDLKYEHYYASLSTDGSEIVFSSSLPDRKGFNIFIVNSDGSNLRQLTSGMGDFYSPALSPDGQYIAATRHVSGKNYITLLSRNGDYIDDLNLYHDCKDPVWSPDGSEILFVADPSKSEIQFYVMNRDGSDVRKLTDMEGLRGRCDWSVDGTMASYTGEFEKQNRELFLFGKNQPLKIITSGGDNLTPSFSPDGRWITFMSYRDNFWDPDGCEIYIMRLEDGFTKRLTNNDYCDYQPRWGQ